MVLTKKYKEFLKSRHAIFKDCRMRMRHEDDSDVGRLLSCAEKREVCIHACMCRRKSSAFDLLWCTGEDIHSNRKDNDRYQNEFIQVKHH